MKNDLYDAMCYVQHQVCVEKKGNYLLAKFKELLNEAFTPIQIKWLVFALRNDIKIYIRGDAMTGKTVICRAIRNAGFVNIREAGDYSHGPNYTPNFFDRASDDYFDDHVLHFVTSSDRKHLGITFGAFSNIGADIKEYVTNGYLFDDDDYNSMIDQFEAVYKDDFKIERRNKMTYSEIYNEFYMKTNISGELVADYRPCCKLFDIPDIDNAIVVWLKNGGKIIYTAGGKILGYKERGKRDHIGDVYFDDGTTEKITAYADHDTSSVTFRTKYRKYSYSKVSKRFYDMELLSSIVEDGQEANNICCVLWDDDTRKPLLRIKNIKKEEPKKSIGKAWFSDKKSYGRETVHSENITDIMRGHNGDFIFWTRSGKYEYSSVQEKYFKLEISLYCDIRADCNITRTSFTDKYISGLPKKEEPKKPVDLVFYTDGSTEKITSYRKDGANVLFTTLSGYEHIYKEQIDADPTYRGLLHKRHVFMKKSRNLCGEPYIVYNIDHIEIHDKADGVSKLTDWKQVREMVLKKEEPKKSIGKAWFTDEKTNTHVHGHVENIIKVERENNGAFIFWTETGKYKYSSFYKRYFKLEMRFCREEVLNCNITHTSFTDQLNKELAAKEKSYYPCDDCVKADVCSYKEETMKVFDEFNKLRNNDNPFIYKIISRPECVHYKEEKK